MPSKMVGKSSQKQTSFVRQWDIALNFFWMFIKYEQLHCKGLNCSDGEQKLFDFLREHFLAYEHHTHNRAFVLFDEKCGALHLRSAIGSQPLSRSVPSVRKTLVRRGNASRPRSFLTEGALPFS